MEADPNSINIAGDAADVSENDQPPRRLRKPSVKARLNQGARELSEYAIQPTEPTGSARATTTRTSSATKERAKTAEEDNRALLLAMGKQMKDLHASLRVVFDAWKKSELRNRDIQDKLLQATTELKTAKEELQTIKNEFQSTNGKLEALKRQAEEESLKMSEKFEALKHQVEEESFKTNEKLEALTILASVQTSPSPSYADVARTPPNSQPSNIRTLTSGGTTPSNVTDTLYCTIDTSRVDTGEGDKPNAGTIRAAVEKEIRARDGYDKWRCRAVTIDPRNADRIRIACRDEAEHHMVKQTAEKNVAPGVRVLRDDLYPLKVDNVKRTEVLDENGEIRHGAAEAFSKENETTVAKIAWLSDRDTPKAYGSMVVYVTKASDARRLISEGFFHAGGESGTTMVFERRPRPQQCYNCQQITRHKAYQCKNPKVCGRCAKEGHHHSECRETIAKCVPCGGPHESFSKNCPKLYPSLHE